MSKLRLLVGISVAAMFTVVAVQAEARSRVAHGKKAAVEKCVPYGDADLPQMCSGKK
jgi:hypothetical protein